MHKYFILISIVDEKREFVICFQISFNFLFEVLNEQEQSIAMQHEIHSMMSMLNTDSILRYSIVKLIFY